MRFQFRWPTQLWPGFHRTLGFTAISWEEWATRSSVLPRQLAIGPTSAIAMLVGATVVGMAPGDPTRSAAIASLPTAALAVAVFGGLAWLFAINGLVSFISETILTGFKAGAALTIALTQLPKLFDVPGGGDNFFERAWILLGQLGETNPLVLVLGVGAISLLVLGDKLFPGRPVALLVVASAILTVSLGGLGERNVPIVGSLPAGLPAFEWPSLRFRDVDGILPLAAACFLLGYVESVSAARTLAAMRDYQIDTRQELLALGAANLLAAFFHGFPIAGGLSQSAVNDKAGARTPLALVFASATIAVCLLFLTDLLRNLPMVVLAAIVLVAVKGLIDIAALRHLWRVSRFEFSIAMVALGGVLVLGILKGVLLAVVVSLLLLLATAARAPCCLSLGAFRATRRYSDLDRHPDNELTPDVLKLFVRRRRCSTSTSTMSGNRVWAKVGDAPSLRLVVCDLSNSPHLDVAAASMLAALHRQLAARGIEFRIVEAHARVRDLLRAEGWKKRSVISAGTCRSIRRSSSSCNPNSRQ